MKTEDLNSNRVRKNTRVKLVGVMRQKKEILYCLAVDHGFLANQFLNQSRSEGLQLFRAFKTSGKLFCK